MQCRPTGSLCLSLAGGRLSLRFGRGSCATFCSTSTAALIDAVSDARKAWSNARKQIGCKF